MTSVPSRDHSLSPFELVVSDSTSSHSDPHPKQSPGDNLKSIKRGKVKQPPSWTSLEVEAENNNEHHGACLCCYEFRLKDLKQLRNTSSNQRANKSLIKKQVDKKVIQSTLITSPNNNIVDGNNNNEHLLKSFQTYKFDQLNISLDDFTTMFKTSKQNDKDCQNEVPPLPDQNNQNIHIDNQTEFFKRISEILSSFVDLYSYLLFKLNNKLDFDVDTYFYKFEKFEEFVKYSGPLMKWLKKCESTTSKSSKDFESMDYFKEKIGASNNHDLVNDQSRYLKLESELNTYKKKLDSMTCLDFESGTDNDELNESAIVKEDEMFEKCKRYEERIDLLMIEIHHLKNKLNLINSKEYKVIKSNTYESLKFKLEVYQQDFKLEHREKEHFQRECLLLKDKLKNLSSSSSSSTKSANSTTSYEELSDDF